MFVVLDTTFGALASVARPFIQETISSRRPRRTRRSGRCRVIRPFLADSPTLFADLQPGVTPCARPRRSWSTRSTGHPGAHPVASQLNAQLPPTAEALEAFGTNPGVKDGLRA